MAHTLEIIDGILYSYGDNDYGQLGLGNIERHDTKEKVVTGIPAYDSIPWILAKTGLNHSVGVKKDKSIWFWGSNIEGQIGKPISIKYVDKPVKIDFAINANKDISINTGLYFTIVSQTSEKSYGLGSFQNFKSDVVEIYREIIPLYFLDPAGDIFLTVNTGPKTIVGRIADFGYVYADWSGDLYPSEYVKFSSLRIGDYFTLYDPSNRERLLYKKVDTYQITEGCCKINALCMHRKYRELLNYVTIVYPTLRGFAVEELLGDDREKLIPSKEQYGATFSFYSAIAGINIMSSNFPNNIDPVTLKGMYLATGKKNLLDLLLYGGLYFSPNTSETLNINSIVEKIDAREVFKKDVFPPYFEEISDYRLFPGDAYNPDPLQQYNTYDRAAPVYYFKLDKDNKPIKYKVAHKGFLYKDPIVRMSELDNRIFDTFFNKDNGFFYNTPNDQVPTNPTIIQKETNLPANENNHIIIEDLILTNPYLISYNLTEGKSSFGQTFIDPYLRVKTQDPSTASIACNDPGTGGPIQTISPEDSQWLYECVYKTATKSYPTFNIGPLAQQLIDYFLKDTTDPEETKKFFGFDKFELEELYNTIKNVDYSKPGVSVAQQSFELLRDVLNLQINKKLYFSPTNNQPIYKIDTLNNSEASDTILFSNIIKNYTDRGIIDTPGKITIPYKKITCFTYFQKIQTITNNKISYVYKPDRKTVVVPIDITDRIVATNTKISYWVPKTFDKNGGFDKSMSNLKQETMDVVITNVIYEDSTNLTKITLDRPVAVDYIIGCVPYPGPPRGCGPIIGPQIYYNKPFDTAQALQDTTGSL